MSESENQSNIDIKNSNNEISMDQHSKYEELIGDLKCQLTDEIYPPQNEEDAHNKYDQDNKSEADDRKSTNLDSVISEEDKNPNPKPIKIVIKNSTEEDKDITKNLSETNINLSDNEDNFLQHYLDQIKEPQLESPIQSQSENSNNEVTYKIELNNEINCNPKFKLIGKKTKRNWKLQALRLRTSKKNKINDFIIRTCLELVNFKNNNIAEDDEDEDGDRLNIRENNFPEVYCNRKFYSRGYSPHIIELEESLTRYNASFRNLETISTKCNSLEANGY
jgi:hypothetical protein